MIPLAFIKMLMTDDLEDTLTRLFLTFLAVIIVCIAWWTTNIREQPQYRTVVLFDRRIQRNRNSDIITARIQRTAYLEEEQSEEPVTTSEGNNTSTPHISETNKPPQPSTSSSTNEGSGSSNSNNYPLNVESEEVETIVQIMDADANVVRLRRVAYFQNQQEGGNRNVEEIEITSSFEEPTSDSQQCVASSSNNSEGVQISNEPVVEPNYAERETVLTSPVNNSQTAKTSNPTNSNSGKKNNSNIRIKLKYLNDELKLVEGNLREQLGDFKRRHFHPEFSSNKLVRLIFNGQVLQRDTETLQNCGLFDNCVVHCLIHQQRNVFSESNNSRGSFTNNNNTRMGDGLPQSNNNQGRDWDLINILLLLMAIILASAWYFRFVYAHLYTFAATMALVVVTVISAFFFMAMHYPSPAPPPIPINHQSTDT